MNKFDQAFKKYIVEDTEKNVPGNTDKLLMPEI